MTKILIAKDERDIRALIAFTQRFAGYEAIAANYGEEAVSLTLREVPDLVTTDVPMPKMTGYEACKLIKADPTTQHIPVVFLSAKGQGAEAQRGLASGGDEYLLNPFAPDHLTRKVAEILGNNKLALHLP